MRIVHVKGVCAIVGPDFFKEVWVNKLRYIKSVFIITIAVYVKSKHIFKAKNNL